MPPGSRHRLATAAVAATWLALAGWWLVDHHALAASARAFLGTLQRQIPTPTEYDAVTLAKQLLGGGDLVGAEREATLAAATDAGAEAMFVLGELHRRRGDLVSAERQLDACLRIDPRQFACYVALQSTLESLPPAERAAKRGKLHALLASGVAVFGRYVEAAAPIANVAATARENDKAASVHREARDALTELSARLRALDSP